GKWLAFLGEDPKSDQEEKDEKERRDQIVRDADLKYSRLYVLPAEGHSVDAEPRRITGEGNVHIADFDWLPDSSGFVVRQVRGPRADEVGYGPSDLLEFP